MYLPLTLHKPPTNVALALHQLFSWHGLEQETGVGSSSKEGAGSGAPHCHWVHPAGFTTPGLAGLVGPCSRVVALLLPLAAAHSK